MSPKQFSDINDKFTLFLSVEGCQWGGSHESDVLILDLLRGGGIDFDMRIDVFTKASEGIIDFTFFTRLLNIFYFQFLSGFSPFGV